MPDFSLYFVAACGSNTRFWNPGTCNFDRPAFVLMIDEAIKGGVTAVQLRLDGTIDTQEFIKTAKAVHVITIKAGIPLFIYDRIDVLLASGAEGLEVSKGCADIITARSLIGEDKLIGVGISNMRQVDVVSQIEIAYINIHPVYTLIPGDFSPTGQAPIGASSVREILTGCLKLARKFPCVISGGLTKENLQMAIFKCNTPPKKLDGVMFSSLISDSREPKAFVSELKKLCNKGPIFAPGVNGFLPLAVGANNSPTQEVQEIIKNVPDIIARVSKERPAFGYFSGKTAIGFLNRISSAINSSLVHSGTEEIPLLVDTTLSAFMSLDSRDVEKHLAVLRVYNSEGMHVFLDIANMNVSEVLRANVTKLWSNGYIAVVKGSLEELQKLYILTEAGTGKDSRDIKEELKSDQERAEFCKRIAVRERNVVIATGVSKCLITDGDRTLMVKGGNPILKHVSGVS